MGRVRRLPVSIVPSNRECKIQPALNVVYQLDEVQEWMLIVIMAVRSGQRAMVPAYEEVEWRLEQVLV